MSGMIKAMVMSAGVGSRLDPLTKAVPKPLVPVANKPVMDILFEKLHAAGINDIICNTYYLADQIINRYKNNNLGINFNYIKEDTLSGTAGGVKKCQFFFDENNTFVVLSADGLTNADIIKGIEIHNKSNAIATIGIKQIPMEDVPHFGVVVTDENGNPIVGATVVLKGSTIGAATNLNGEYTIDIQQNNATLVFSLIGYNRVEVALSDSQTLANVTLKAEAIAMDDIVVDEVVILGKVIGLVRSF